MGSCFSTPNGRPRTRRFNVGSKKRCGKISALVPDEPASWKIEKEDRYACRDSDQSETATSSRRKVEVSNLAAHLTQLQWRRSQVDISYKREESFDCSFQDSDSDEDCNSIRLGDSFGDRKMLSEDFDGTLVRADRNHTKINQDEIEILSKEDEPSEPNEIQICKVNEVLFNNHEHFCTTANYSDDLFTTFRAKMEQMSRKSLLKQCESSSTSYYVPFTDLNDNIRGISAASVQYNETISAVIRHSYERKLEVQNKACEICSNVLKLEGLLYILEIPSFEFSGSFDFRNGRKSLAPGRMVDIAVGLDTFLSHRIFNYISCHIKLPFTNTNQELCTQLAVNVKRSSGLRAMFFCDNYQHDMKVTLVYFDEEYCLRFQDGLLQFFSDKKGKLAELVEVDDALFSGMEKLINTYNSVLPSSLHKFYMGPKCVTMDLDICHCFIARTGVDSLPE